MNFVEPICDCKKIAQIKNLLRGQARFRDSLLFVVGINTALRISDLLQLRLGHFLDEKGYLKNRFWIKEQKRGKRPEIVINESMRTAFSQYLATYPGLEENENHFLFFNTKALDYTQPIQPASPGRSCRFSVNGSSGCAGIRHHRQSGGFYLA